MLNTLATAQSLYRPDFLRALGATLLTWAIAISLLFGLTPRDASAQSAYEQQVQQMYVAYYGRPGDPGGVAYWAGELAAVGGNWIPSLVNAFGTSAEYTDRFGALSDATLINNLFLQLFNRDVDEVGLGFYLDLLSGSNLSGFNPQGRQSTLAQIALDIANGVQAGNSDADTLNNKLIVAAAFTDAIRLTASPYGNDELPAAVDLIGAVDANDESVADAQVRIAQMTGGGLEQRPLTAGDLTDSDPNVLKAVQTLGTASAALIQSIYAVNTFAFTDPSVTDFSAYQRRYEDAVRALDILIMATDAATDAADELAPDLFLLNPQQEGQLLFASAASPDEVLAVLNSSNSKWPIRTLMNHYKVNAKRAQLILNNAMNGLISEAYQEQAQVETQAITRLTLVKEASGLAVTVGATVITAGGAAGALSATQAGVALVTGADAIIKTTKAGAELVLGEDGKLDDAYKNNALLTGLSDVSEILAIKGLFTKSENLLDVTNKLTYITGKISDLLQESKTNFGSHTLDVSKLTSDQKTALNERIRNIKIPTTLPGEFQDEADGEADGETEQVSVLEVPDEVTEALDSLPQEQTIDAVQNVLNSQQQLTLNDAGLTLSAVETGVDIGSKTYLVSAALAGVSQPVDLTLSVSNALFTGTDSRLLFSDGIANWSVIVLEQDGSARVSRSDTGASLSLTLPGMTDDFNGTYVGTARTTWEEENAFCWSSWEAVTVVVNGTQLSGDAVGTLSGNRVHGVETFEGEGATFSGSINNNVMAGTWVLSGWCGGSFSLVKQ